MIEHASQAVAYLDANVFIFFYEGDAAISERAKNLFDALRKHPGAGVTSELTLAEVLAESERPRNAMLKRAYLDLIVWSKFIDLVPIGREILYDSVDLRANHKRAHGRKLDLPDAIHLTTAIAKKCRFFISADDKIETPAEMTKLSPLTTNFEAVIQVLS